MSLNEAALSAVPERPRAARTDALVALIDAVPGWRAGDFDDALRHLVTPDVAAYLRPNAPEAIFTHASYYGTKTTLAVFRVLAGYAFPTDFVKQAVAQFIREHPEKGFPPLLARALELLYENEYASICRSSFTVSGNTVATRAIDELVRHPLWRWAEFHSGLVYAGVENVWRNDFAFMDLLKNRNNLPDIEVERCVALYIFSSLRVMDVPDSRVLAAALSILNRHNEQFTETGGRFRFLVSTLYTELKNVHLVSHRVLSGKGPRPSTIHWEGVGDKK